MRRLLILTLVFLGAAAAFASTPTVNPELVRAADYEFRYLGRDLGDETFSVIRTGEGYVINAELALSVGDQKPSRSQYVLDQNRRLVSATYEELVQGGARAEYRIEAGVLIARRLDAAGASEIRIELEEGAIVTGPHYVTDFFVLKPLGLDVGDRHEQVAYAFGFDGWAPSRVGLKSKRERNKRVADLDGAKVDTMVYSCVIDTGRKKYRTRSYLDADGISVRISVRAPIGSMKVILDREEREVASAAE